MQNASEKNPPARFFGPWLTKRESAEYLRVSEKTIDRKRAAGELRAYLVKGTATIRFRRSDLDEIMT